MKCALVSCAAKNAAAVVYACCDTSSAFTASSVVLKLSLVSGTEAAFVGAAGVTAASPGKFFDAENRAETYDPIKKKWSPVAVSMIEARFFHTATKLGVC